jgi:hypothetical protein
MLLTQATLFLDSPFTFDAACASVYIDCLLRREAEGAGEVEEEDLFKGRAMEVEVERFQM